MCQETLADNTACFIVVDRCLPHLAIKHPIPVVWRNQRCLHTAQGNYALDNAFALIEGHPFVVVQAQRPHPSKREGGVAIFS
jgi:hypothetical protein